VSRLARYLAFAYVAVALVSCAYLKYRHAKELGFVQSYVIPGLEMEQHIGFKAALWPFFLFEDEQRSKIRTQARTVNLVVMELAPLAKELDGIGYENPPSMELKIRFIGRLDRAIADLQSIDKGVVDEIHPGLGMQLSEQLLPALQALKEYHLTGDLNQKKRFNELFGPYEQWLVPRVDSIRQVVNQAAR
jgi:hypothetical protein